VEINQSCSNIDFEYFRKTEMKKRLRLVVIAALVCLIFAACFLEFEQPAPGSVTGGWGSPAFFTGRVDGSGPGYNGNVIVTIDLVNGFITDVDFDLRTQTASFTRTLPNRLRPIILRTNSFNYPDATGGASLTNRGIKAAAREAMLKIEGVTEDDLDF